MTFRILGMDEIEAYFTALGKVPQNAVTKAARAGGNLLRNKVKGSSQMPRLSGAMRRGVISVREKRSSGGRVNSGKSTFWITFDRTMNSIFQKPIQRVGIYGGTRSHGYYPASMEYGFKTAKGRIEGHHALRDMAEQERGAVEDKMLEILSKEIDRIETKRAGGR